jgi:hypothetical protein
MQRIQNGGMPFCESDKVRCELGSFKAGLVVLDNSFLNGMRSIGQSVHK